MKTNDELLAEAIALEERATELRRHAEERDKYGPDPFKNGAVLKVEMRYRTGSRRSFTYAVVKVAGRFYLTGRLLGDTTVVAGELAQRGFTWEQFVAWLAQGDATVWRARQLEQVL